MKDFSLYIGVVSGIFTGVSLLPQLIKLLKEKKAEDISIVMFLILLMGLGGWIWYGVLKSDYPIIVTNGFSFIVNIFIISFSLAYKKNLNTK